MSTRASYPARQLRRRRGGWTRRHVRSVALVVTFILLFEVVPTISILWLVGPSPWRFYVLGAIHVAGLAAALHLLNSAFLAFDPQAISQVRGSWGEDNTRSELRRAQRKRLIWGWIDSVELQVGDIDHIVVTRRGGVVMLDSKWRNHISSHMVPEMAASARRCALRAEGVLRTVLKRETGARHRRAAHPVAVTPAVVLWGAARTSVPEDANRDGVRFLDGRQLLPWLASLEGHDVPKEAAREVLTLLKSYRARAISAERPIW